MPKILFEDNKILVVEKPPGIPVQEDSSNDPDLLSILKDYVKEKYNKPGNVFLGLVHRLDRPVGGLMVFARNSKTAANLSEQIRTHTFKKTYLAVAEGEIDIDGMRLEDYLLKDEETNIVSVVPSSIPGAQRALLDYKVLRHKDNLTLVEINLITGRPHQIRVQFANIGHPLYGDLKYGNGKPGIDIALWSQTLEFIHPGSKEVISFTQEPPKNHPWNLFL